MHASTTHVKTAVLVLTAPELTTHPPAELVPALVVSQVFLAQRTLMNVPRILARTVLLVLMVPTTTLVIAPQVRYGLERTVVLMISVLKLLLVTDTVLAPMLRVLVNPEPMLTPTRSYGLVLSVLTKITVRQTLAQLNRFVSVLRQAQAVTVTWVTVHNG